MFHLHILYIYIDIISFRDQRVVLWVDCGYINFSKIEPPLNLFSFALITNLLSGTMHNQTVQTDTMG